MISETKLSIPLKGLVDFEKLKATINNKIEKIEKDIDVLEKRLSSENFVKNDSPDKVEETKESLNGFLEQKKLFNDELLTLS